MFCYFPTYGQDPNLGDGQYHLLETTVNGMTRNYTLYEPEEHDGAEEWPLVFVLHGFSTPVDIQIEISQMYLVADTAKFLSVSSPASVHLSDILCVLGGKNKRGRGR